MRNYGFTLIELLVVIGIIGILSSAALLRYPITIEKVKDARVISEMDQFREQAGVLATLTGQFTEVVDCVLGPPCVCSMDKSLDILCKDIQDSSDENLILYTNSNESGFCFTAHLPAEGNYFCVDSYLRSKQYAAIPLTCVASCEVANSCACE